MSALPPLPPMVLSCRSREHRDDGQWDVVVRNGNYSAFNGYHFTPSDYSLVRCTACGRHWRTRADYVRSLPDAPEGAV